MSTVRLWKQVGVFGLGTLVSRLFGVVRDVLMALILGSSAFSDMFFVAFRLPNLFRRLMADGALHNAVTIHYAEQKNLYGASASNRFIRKIFWFFGGWVFILSVVAIVFMDAIVVTLAPSIGVVAWQRDLTVLIGRIMFPYLACMVFASVFMAVTQVHKQFGPAAFGPVWLNIMLIMVLTFFMMMEIQQGQIARAELVVALAVTVLVAGILHLLWMVVWTWRVVPTWLFPRLSRQRVARWFNPDASVRAMLRTMLPTVVIAGSLQFNMLVDQWLASLLGAGAISHIFYADRFIQLPLTMIGLATSHVLLSGLVAPDPQSNAFRTRADANETINQTLMIVWILTFPATLGLIIIAEDLVSIVYEHGAFTVESRIITANIMKMLALGLPAFCWVKTLQSVVYAHKGARRIFGLVSLTLPINLAIGWFLKDVLAESGIALATTITGWLYCVGIGLAAHRYGWWDASGLFTRRRIVDAACVGVYALGLMALVLWCLEWVRTYQLNTWLHLSVLMAVVCITVGLYLGGVWCYTRYRRRRFPILPVV